MLQLFYWSHNVNNQIFQPYHNLSVEGSSSEQGFRGRQWKERTEGERSKGLLTEVEPQLEACLGRFSKMSFIKILESFHDLYSAIPPPSPCWPCLPSPCWSSSPSPCWPTCLSTSPSPCCSTLLMKISLLGSRLRFSRNPWICKRYWNF